MAKDPESKQSPDNSSAAILFPDAKTIFGVRLKPLSEIKGDCLIVLDTNVLLVPYTINPKGLHEIANAYKTLVSEKRLVIPAQVAREFAKNRPNKLSELYQQLTTKKSKASQFQHGQYPLLESIPEYNEVVKIEKELDDKILSYKSAISKVLEHVRSWTWDDPVSVLYGELFGPDTVIEPGISQEDLDSDLKRRQQHKIPPGYKDAAKDDSGIGDVLIWHTILELGRKTKRSIIFVSGESKPDWFHQSDGSLYPRFELVDEFRRNSDGASFHILKLSDFLGLYDVGQQVVQEVRQEEAKLSPVDFLEPSKRISDDAACTIAVINWLRNKVPSYTPQDSSRHPTLDGFLVAPDGDALGLIIKRIRRSSHPSRRIRELIESIRSLPSSAPQEIMLCIVADDQEAALQYEHLLERRKRESGSWRVCIGYLDGSGIFIEVSLFRFD